MTSADHVEYRRFAPAEADLLAEFLTTEDWPYHGTRGRDAAHIRQDAAAGRYSRTRLGRQFKLSEIRSEYLSHIQKFLWRAC
jgi:hypothetical protein